MTACNVWWCEVNADNKQRDPTLGQRRVLIKCKTKSCNGFILLFKAICGLNYFWLDKVFFLLLFSLVRLCLCCLLLFTPWALSVMLGSHERESLLIWDDEVLTPTQTLPRPPPPPMPASDWSGRRQLSADWLGRRHPLIINYRETRGEIIHAHLENCKQHLLLWNQLIALLQSVVDDAMLSPYIIVKLKSKGHTTATINF